MKWFKSFFIISLMSGVFSCSTTRMTQLRPVDQDFILDDGKQVVKQEKNGVKVVASYDGRFEKYMVFDVEVFNNTRQPLRISPQNFTSISLDEHKQHLVSVDGKHTDIHHGIEPQQQINYIHHQITNQNNKIKRARVINTVLFVGGIMALIAGETGRSEGAWRTARLGETVLQVAQAKRIIDHQNYYSTMDRLNREGRVWSQETFSTSTLLPGESLRGGVFLESNPKAKFIQLSYNMEDDPIRFMFEQCFK